jgi:putative IMPACT (imprinted ancient) family translation regulator
MLDATAQVGWFDEILDNDSLGRGTGVVTRHKNGWKLNHYSLALLIPNSVADEAGALIQSVDLKAAQSEHVQSKAAQGQLTKIKQRNNDKSTWPL